MHGKTARSAARNTSTPPRSPRRKPRSATPGCGTTGRSVRPSTSSSVRRYYDFVDVDTDRYLIDDEQRQVMLSARELALEQNPLAIGFVNERIIYTHGIGAAMVPVTEVANEGQPRLFIRNLLPVSSDGAWRSPSHGSTSASGRRITSSPAPDRPSSISRPARARAAPIPGTETRWTGGTDPHRQHADAVAVRGPRRRPRPAHQRPGDCREPTSCTAR